MVVDGQVDVNHSADRRYYIARNDTVMLREYGHTLWDCGY